MISTQGLSDELSDLGKLIGLLKDDGTLNSDWFNNPIASLENIFGTGSQRDAFTSLLNALAPPEQPEGIPPGESWHPLLGPNPNGNVYLTVNEQGSSVIFGAGGEFGGSLARLRAQLPLVNANTGVQALSGPLRLQFRVQLGLTDPVGLDAISVTATIAPPEITASVKLEKLSLNGAPAKDVVLDPSGLGPEAVHLIAGLLQQAFHDATASPGSEADAVIKHLLPLLGVGDPAIPQFPFTDISQLQSWLNTLLEPATITAWLTHLASLMGTGGAPVTGSGSAADPWAITLVPIDADSALSLTAALLSNSLAIGFRVSAQGAAGTLLAEATLASIPLAGTAHASVLPSASFLFVNGPGLVSQPGISVSTVRAGINWNGTSLQPLLELLDVTFAGAHYDRLDLTNTNSVESALTAAIENAILDALGNGAGRNLAALATLIPPASDPGSTHLADLALLVTNPAAAIAKAHREALLDSTHSWGFLLGEIGSLLGLADGVSGTGTAADPWVIGISPAAPIGISLAAWNAQTSGNPADTQQLRLGLQASVASSPARFAWLAELLAFDLPQSGPGKASIMAGQHASFLVKPGPSLPPTAGFTLGADSFEAAMDWSPGSPMQWDAKVSNLNVSSNGTSINVAELHFPPAGGFDSSNPSAAATSLGLSVADLESLLRLLLAKAALSWGQMPGYVLATLTGTNKALSGLQSDWPLLANFISDPFPALRTFLGYVATDLSATDHTPFLPVALNWLEAFISGALPNAPDSDFPIAQPDGLGTYDDPWVLPLSSELSADALVWLEPAGPPASWATAIASRAGSVTDFVSLIQLGQQLASFLPNVADAFRDIDAATLSIGLAELAGHLTNTDGVVPIESQIPSGGSWTAGTPIVAAHPLQPHDPSAISQIKAQIDALAGGPAAPRAVLLLGPFFSDHSTWSDLIGGSPSANFNLRVPGVDPSAVNLDTVAGSVDFYTADLADTGDLVSQIGRLVARIGQLRPGIPVTLVAHSTAGVAARTFTSANPAQVKGLITLGTPHFGADLPFLSDPALAGAIRLMQSLRAGIAAGPVRDALDHIVAALDGYLPPPGPGALPIPFPYPADAFAGSAAIDTGGKPALALGGVIAGDLISELAQAITTLAANAADSPPHPPTHLAFALRAHLDFPSSAAGDVNIDASVRVNAFRLKLAQAVTEPARPAQGIAVRVYLNRQGDWLLNTPTVSVRTAEFGVDLTGTATPFLNLHQAACRGPLAPRLTLADPTAQAVLGEIMHSISVPAPISASPAGALLSALQALGVATAGPNGGIGISGDAFAAIMTDTAGFFATRLPAALAAGVAGLNAPVSLGSLPLELVVSPKEASIRTAPSLAISDAASLSFDTSVPSASLNIGALKFTFSNGQLNMDASPWLAPIVLPPDSGTLKTVLDSALPRLLFSSAAGALLEALMGPGFPVGALDSFFSNTGGTASGSQALGSNGSGFDGGRINQLFQILNSLAGFADGPGFSLPEGLQLTASGIDPAVISLSTTAPIGGILGLSLSASIDRLLHVAPAGTLTITTPLPGGTWPSVAITFGADPSGLSLSVAPEGLPPIRILPKFSGLGPLMGAAEALLPKVLDQVVTALEPAPALLTDALALASALGLYDSAGHFAAHTDDLRALLSGNWLSQFDASKRTGVAGAAATFLNSLGGLPGSVSASGSTVNWEFSLGGADSGTIRIGLGWDGSGPTTVLSATDVKFANGAIALTVTAGYANNAIQCQTNLSVPLGSALGLDIAPMLEVKAAGSAFQAKLYPLAKPPAPGSLEITLAPAIGVTPNPNMAGDLANELFLPLVADVAVQATKSHLGDVVWTDNNGTKTVRDLLTAAKVLDAGDKLHSPLPDVLTMAAGLLTNLSGLGIDVTKDLKLTLVSSGMRFGIGLSGHLDFNTPNFAVTTLFGAPADWDSGADEGVVLNLFDTGAQGPFNPGLTVAGLGLGLAGLDDSPLIDLDQFRLGGFRGYVFFESEFKSGPLFTDFGAGISLDALGLPLGLATGGNVGGDNPVAASLLRSDSGSGNGDPHPVNPAVDVEAWSWHQPFRIRFGGKDDAILWISVHRGFGPVHIDQVGLEVGNTSVGLLIDGSVQVAGLTAQVDELTIDVPYQGIATPAMWSLDLKGLGVGYQGPGVTVAGGLVKSDGPPVEYDGMLMIQISEFGFIAIGAYSTPTDPAANDTYTSLFVFAGMFVIIGIPPIIEISGLGLGIGYNRQIIVPTDLEQVPNFILVEALDDPGKIADDPMGALLSLRNQMPARRGSFWLAAGLRGTSFVVVHVTAIVYVALDRGLEIGILGVARMALPSDDTALVSVELALKVRFSQAESLFSIQAQLTSNSYLLSRDCQLTGGFAYFMWFARSQFLLTLGGYHPAFHKEPEYPDLPRLGYHWSYLGVVNIKGESYFALTNTCVMAGTRFEATYGPDWLQVWLTAYCDFLLSWEPFYYDFSIGISVGARFHIHLLFVDCDVTVSLGASLRVQGPPLHGEVTVDLDVASVTVAFGDKPQPNMQGIDWPAFVQKYLHADQPGNEAAVSHVLTGLLAPDPPGGRPSPGTQEQPWKLASEWSFQTETRMPAMEFSFQTEFARNEGEWATKVFGYFSNLSTVYKFDIAPMLLDGAKRMLTSKHKVVISAWDDQKQSWFTMVPADSPNLPADDRFILHGDRFLMEPVISQVSEATYHLLPHDGVPAAARTLPVVTGLKITGVAVLENESQPIPITKLFAAGHSRPLPFATLTPVLIGALKTLGAAADALGSLGAAASTSTVLSAASTMLSGAGFFSQARADSGLDPQGLPPLATRALKKFRSSPPLLTPITTGLTMNPVGQKPPPVIRKIPPVTPVPLTSPRLRAVLQGTFSPTTDAPPLLRTTVTKVTGAEAARIPRLSPPQLDTVAGARLHFVRAATAPSPTRLARTGRTLRSYQFGWSSGQAHMQQFADAEARIGGSGVTVPAGTTHVWDITGAQGETIQISSRTQGIARVTLLTQAGNVLEDHEMSEGQMTVPEGCAMVALTCLGKASGGIAGWQTGNRAVQVGSTALLCRKSVITLPQHAPTVKGQVPTSQATVRLSEPMVDQPGVETLLPVDIDVIGILLDVQDLCSSADGDLAVAVTGAEVKSPPVRVVGGRRKMLLYDIASHDPKATRITVAVASRQGARMAGIVGLNGTAREWGIRFNGGVPEQLVPDGPSSPDGDVLVRIFKYSAAPAR